MSVFSLAVYSCITILAPLSGELIQKTCNWNDGGTLYATEAACQATAPAVGSRVFSDIADGRKVEATKCNSHQVLR